MIPDVSTAKDTNSKSATRLEYFRLFRSSAALDAEPGLKMVEHRSLAEESVQVASHANALPHLKGKDVFCRRTDQGRPVREWSEGKRYQEIFL